MSNTHQVLSGTARYWAPKEVKPMIAKGERFTSSLTGKTFEVKMISGGRVLLETENGSCQVMTDMENLKLFYTKLEHVASPCQDGRETEGIENGHPQKP